MHVHKTFHGRAQQQQTENAISQGRTESGARKINIFEQIIVKGGILDKSHVITSSYNPFIIMRTHRWPYGPCSIFFFLLKVFNICRSRLRQTRVIIWLSLSPEWICLFDASKLKWSESERSRVGIFTVLSLYRIRFWAAAPKGAMCLTIKLTSAVYNFIAVAMICYGL